jgi:hypothetical protein
MVKYKKNRDTYEYRENTVETNYDSSLVYICICTENTLNKELKKPSDKRFLFTSDTHKFFLDFNGKRYELNLSGERDGIKKEEILKIVEENNFVKRETLDEYINKVNETILTLLSEYVNISQLGEIKENMEKIIDRLDGLECWDEFNQEDSE